MLAHELQVNYMTSREENKFFLVTGNERGRVNEKI
jgi:hypothetical protein